jgi:hypothetical protein
MLPRPTAATPAADFIITYHGTVATLDVLSCPCLSWVEENVAVEPWQSGSAHPPSASTRVLPRNCERR